MSVEVPPTGTRGVSMPRLPGPFMRVMNDLVFRMFRNRPFQGATLLSLTTIGARSGQERRTTISSFADGPGAWLVVASGGGTARHPAWFLNMARHPDRVWAQIGNRRMRVRPETLHGQERAQAWQRITRQSPVFSGYETKTDREIPVIRLSEVA